tara:strand:- start:65 stop:925 length:861 start_codon:yes stop_codon:yes gene_type:complete
MAQFYYNGQPFIFITNNYFTEKGGDTYARFLEFNEKSASDIIFTGSSRAYRGYDPLIFDEVGVSSFNLGSSAQKMPNTALIISHLLNSENTSKIVLELYPNGFTDDISQSDFDLITNVKDDKLAVKIALKAKDPRLVNTYLTRLLFSGFNSDLPIDNEYVSRGFCKSDSVMSDETYKDLELKYSKDNSNNFNIQGIRHLDSIANHCKNENIELILVTSPVSDFYSQKNHSKLILSIQPILDDYNLRYLDYSQNTNFNTKDDFYDASHLNYTGVKKFNEILIKDLGL